MLKMKNKCYGVTANAQSFMNTMFEPVFEDVTLMLRHVTDVTANKKRNSVTKRNTPRYGDKASCIKALQLSVTP